MIFGAGPNLFTHFIMNLKKKKSVDFNQFSKWLSPLSYLWFEQGWIRL